jgi:hypothetical protein
VEVLFIFVTLDVIDGVEAMPFPRLISSDSVGLTATTLPTALTATSTAEVTLPSIAETADCKMGRAPPVTVAVAVAVVCTASVAVLVTAASLVFMATVSLVLGVIVLGVVDSCRFRKARWFVHRLCATYAL